MKERDYIISSELTRLRCAVETLSHVTPENAAGPMKVPQAQAVTEYQHIMSCLDSWVARLELAAGGERDDEPWRRDWPGASKEADRG